jgi:hypothetical protein
LSTKSGQVHPVLLLEPMFEEPTVEARLLSKDAVPLFPLPSRFSLSSQSVAQNDDRRHGVWKKRVAPKALSCHADP